MNKGDVVIRDGTEIFSVEDCKNGGAIIREKHLRGRPDLGEICEHERTMKSRWGALHAVENVDWNSERGQGWMYFLKKIYLKNKYLKKVGLFSNLGQHYMLAFYY